MSEPLCPCVQAGGLADRVVELFDEVVEWLQHPCQDEASDVVWAVGRLLGFVLGCNRVSLPGEGPHLRKVKQRVAAYGCVLSPRHFIQHDQDKEAG